MTSPTQSELEKLLASHLSEQEFLAVMDTLSPLTAAAKTDIWSFAPREQLDEAKCTEVFSQLLGHPLEGVRFVSMSNPFPRPEWLGKVVYERSVSACLSNTFSQSLEEMYEGPFCDSLLTEHSDPLWRSLRPSLWPVFKDIYGRCRKGVWEDEMKRDLRKSIGRSFRFITFYFAGFALAQASNQTMLIKPAVQMMRETIPFAHHPDNKRVILATCA